MFPSLGRGSSRRPICTFSDATDFRRLNRKQLTSSLSTSFTTSTTRASSRDAHSVTGKRSHGTGGQQQATVRFMELLTRRRQSACSYSVVGAAAISTRPRSRHIKGLKARTEVAGRVRDPGSASIASRRRARFSGRSWSIGSSQVSLHRWFR